MVLVASSAWTEPLDGLARTTLPPFTTKATEALFAESWTVPRVSVPEPFLVIVPAPVCVEMVMSPAPPTT